jgi:hypothetical protein
MNTLLTEKEFVSRFYGSTRTARRHRALGTGPKFIRIGKRVFYRECAIQAWLNENEWGTH